MTPALPKSYYIRILKKVYIYPLIFYPQNVFMTAELRAHDHEKSSVVKLWSEKEEEEFHPNRW